METYGPPCITSLYFEYRLRPPVFDLDNYKMVMVNAFLLDIDSTRILEVSMRTFECHPQNKILSFVIL